MYIARDGSYGEADGLTIVDTSRWSGEDWEDFNEAADDGEFLDDVAGQINARINREKGI